MNKPHMFYKVRPAHFKTLNGLIRPWVFILKKKIANTMYASPIMVFSADEMRIAFPFWILYFPVIFFD